MNTDVESIIKEIYLGTTDDAAWQRAITAVIDLVGGSSAAMFGITPSTCAVFRAEPFRLDAGELEEFGAQWVDKEVRTKLAIQVPLGESIFDSKLMPVRTWKSTPIYNEFLLRIDKPWILSFWLDKTKPSANMLTIHGSRRRGPFDERDGHCVLPLIPHVQRAFMIRARLEATRMRDARLSELADRLPFGLITLDGQGRILECNAPASALMTRTSGIRFSRDGTLWLQGRAGEHLRRWVLGTGAVFDADAILKTHGPDGTMMSILVVPLPPMGVPWTGRGGRWMLMVFDPARRRATRTSLVSKDLDISLREAELATLLALGLDLNQVAATMRISVHTARTHLKKIFAKTGCGSQSELIRRILSGPASISLANTPVG